MTINPVLFEPIDQSRASPAPSLNEGRRSSLERDFIYSPIPESASIAKSKVTGKDQLIFNTDKIDRVSQETILALRTKVSLKSGSKYVDFPQGLDNIDEFNQGILESTHMTFGGLVDDSVRGNDIVFSFRKESLRTSGFTFVKTIIANKVEEKLETKPISSSPFFDRIPLIIDELVGRGIKKNELDKFSLLIMDPTCEMIDARIQSNQEFLHTKTVADQIRLEREIEVLEAIAELKQRIIEENNAIANRTLDQLFTQIQSLIPEVNKIVIKFRA